jgi:hypothetical protein
MKRELYIVCGYIVRISFSPFFLVFCHFCLRHFFRFYVLRDSSARVRTGEERETRDVWSSGLLILKSKTSKVWYMDPSRREVQSGRQRTTRLTRSSRKARRVETGGTAAHRKASLGTPTRPKSLCGRAQDCARVLLHSCTAFTVLAVRPTAAPGSACLGAGWITHPSAPLDRAAARCC